MVVCIFAFQADFEGTAFPHQGLDGIDPGLKPGSNSFARTSRIFIHGRRIALAASATQSQQLDLDGRRFEDYQGFANKVVPSCRPVNYNYHFFLPGKLIDEKLFIPVSQKS